MPGVTSGLAELVAARRRIAELETELEVHRRAAQLLMEVVPPKKSVRGHQDDGRGGPAG